MRIIQTDKYANQGDLTVFIESRDLVINNWIYNFALHVIVCPKLGQIKRIKVKKYHRI